MSDCFYSTGYDAGAVIDMNNIAIGYIPPSPTCQPTSPVPASVLEPIPQVAQEAQAAMEPVAGTSEAA